MKNDNQTSYSGKMRVRHPAPTKHSLAMSVACNAALVVLTFVVLIPLIWMVTTSIKPRAEVFSAGLSILPKNPTLENFVTLATRFNIPVIVYNTLLVGVLTTAFQILTSVLAAYGFARFDFPFRKILLFACIAQMFIPIQVVMVSNYLLIADLGFTNRLIGVVLPQTSLGLAIFFMYQHFRLFPQPLVDCARIDGAGDLRILILVVLPIVKPIVAAIGTIVFVNRWNQYVWPMLILSEPSRMTLPIWLRQFMHAEAGTNFGLLMGAAAIGVAPALLLYVVLRQTIMDAFLESGLKG